MIRVVAAKTIKKDDLQVFLKLAKELVEETVKEQGCISYELCQDLNDPCKVTILEAWESQQHLARHMQTEHFKRLVPMMGELSEGKGELSIMQKLY